MQGGPPADHIALGTGFAASYQNAACEAATPPANEIENPDPKRGTNNDYTQDGYVRAAATPSAPTPPRPGSAQIDAYLASLPYKASSSNCQPGRYYLLNNYNAGLQRRPARCNTAPYTVPPQSRIYATIGRRCRAQEHQLGLLRRGLQRRHRRPRGYCGICDPMQYSGVDHDQPGAAQERAARTAPTSIGQAAAGTLPAVTFLKPADDDGHPGYSTLAAFENFVARAIAAVQRQPAAVEVHRDLRHDGRGRRVLRLGLHPAGQLLRRRAPGAAHPGLPLRQARARSTTPTPTTCRSSSSSRRTGSLSPLTSAQRGQPAQPDAGGLRAAGPAGHRRPDDHVQLPPSGLREGAAPVTG